MTTEIYNQLKKHDELFNLVINHNYCPQSFSASLTDVIRIHDEHFKSKTQTRNCPDCIIRAFKALDREMRAFVPEVEIKQEVNNEVALSGDKNQIKNKPGRKRKQT